MRGGDGYVYFIRGKITGLTKIGMTTQEVEEKLDDLQTGSPDELIVVGQIATGDPYGLEADLHRKYDELRTHGEWFNLSDEQVTYELLFFNNTDLAEPDAPELVIPRQRGLTNDGEEKEEG